MRKIHANKLHAMLGHPREDRTHATAKHLHYSVKGALEFVEDCAMAKVKYRFLHKEAKECNLNPV